MAEIGVWELVEYRDLTGHSEHTLPIIDISAYHDIQFEWIFMGEPIMFSGGGAWAGYGVNLNLGTTSDIWGAGRVSGIDQMRYYQSSSYTWNHIDNDRNNWYLGGWLQNIPTYDQPNYFQGYLPSIGVAGKRNMGQCRSISRKALQDTYQGTIIHNRCHFSSSSTAKINYLLFYATDTSGDGGSKELADGTLRVWGRVR